MPQQFIQNPLNQFEPEKLAVGWPWRLFWASFFIFLVSVLVYLGIIFGYQPFLESKIQDKDSEISQLADAVPKEDQEKFIQFYSQLVNLNSILNSHIKSSKSLSFLEKITHQKVYYTKATLKASEKKMEMEGMADSYLVLSEQLEALNQSPEIENYILSNSRVGDGIVQFKVILNLNDKVL